MALVSNGAAGENLYREAIGRTRLCVELGRAHLVYGEWLRRQRNRRDARDQLGSAYKIFDSAGAARPTDLEDALERLRALAGGTLAAGIGAPIARFRMVSAGLDLG